MYLPRAALILVLLGAVVNALQAVYAPEGDSDELLLKEAEQRGLNINGLVDQVLISVRKALVLAKEESISLPDITEDFYKNMWPFVVHGHLHCTKGSLRSLSSIKRTGDANLAYKNAKLMVIAPLGLQELTIDYDYDASILHFGTTGNLTANVTSNSITLAVEVSLSVEGCKFKVEETKVTDLGQIHVNLTGLYPFDGLSSAIAEKAVDSLHDTIRQATEQVLHDRIQEVIQKIPCHLPGIKKP
ncbi:uncharacterized protein LOC117640965 [Thrips palmi]|uniref:Uncharacterized protein LOC117640965 n=1 Tax=Thrips palmi TaxID=161013 RepID=A0A6P8Y341_THRPL|nr:uncharacterized protein LOC117640965 [Thrips palmi]XP_034233914.1 uncharacterized protein LOC117640965 [Thrips palmi]